MNPFSSAVNQKLFLAQLLLDQCRPGEDPHGHIELALSQSVVFQLYCAYQLYLSEIAANYRVPEQVPMTTATQLCESLLTIDKHPSEARELENLENQQGSWLNQLVTLHTVAMRARSLGSDSRGNAISLQALEQDLPVSSYRTVDRIIPAFRDLLERHRELMVEC